MRVSREVGEDRAALVAAGVTFYVVLAMFPGMIVIISVYGLVSDASSIGETLSLLRGFAPPSAIDMIGDELARITGNRADSLGLAAIGALVLTLWSANGAMKALFIAMNVAYDEPEKRGFFIRTVYTLGFTVAGIVLLVIILNIIVLVPVAVEYLGLTGFARAATTVLPLLLLFCLLLASISVLYRYGASRRPPKLRWISVGAVAAAVFIVIGSAAFSLYLSNWGDYGATYGSLGTAIALMMWIYLATFIVLVGAELNSEIEHQTAQDTTVGPDRPMGEREAFVADTVGEKA
ncbi:YihY/virulence factor BrkB family protein [Microbaculum marinum]|uniref:YihY/virulence factor BrkB family protein n=1 Tax=Microbaculum marinum TaxID=1764581 RepID=A0AAW9RP49_9HYPH